MAYFLKVSKQQKNTYLSIYESFYSNETKGTKHKCFKHLGNLESLKVDGIEDPIAYYKDEVKRLNEEKKAQKEDKKLREIEDKTPEKCVGHFPVAQILNNLEVKQHFDLMQSKRNFNFNVFEFFSSLVYARLIFPCSKNKTFHDVLPTIYGKEINSYDQLLKSVEFVGSEYERFVEIFTEATRENYGIDTSSTYFDCTNFYFEIDREVGIKKKGPCKHNTRNPIVGMGLLLDKNMLPIGMKVYPGNQSEKPVLREIIKELKTFNKIEGRTIQVADKGLNCARNIIEAVNSGDGYLFSKSVLTLPEKEKKWVLLDNGFKEVKDEDGNPIYKYKSCVENFTYQFTDESGNKYQKTIKEKRVLTYNYNLAAKKTAEIQKQVDKANKFIYSKAKKSEAGSLANYINFVDENGSKAGITINQDAIDKDLAFAGYNLLVTSEVTMNDKAIYDTYHNLWRIEETFKTMKSELDTRPIYLQKDDSIKGHLLICYVAVLLTRLLQFKVLNNELCSEKLFEFFRTFRVVDLEKGKYINISKRTETFEKIAKIFDLPICNYYLTEKQLKKMLTR